MATSNIEIVRTGLEAYKRGDLDTVLELMDPDVRWDGTGAQGSCVNRDEAAAALRAGADRAAGLELADAVPFGTEKVMVCLVRMGDGEDDDAPARIYNVVTFDGGKVVRMQGFLARREAVQAARGIEPESASHRQAGTASGVKADGGPRRRKSLWRRARMAVGRALGRG